MSVEKPRLLPNQFLGLSLEELPVVGLIVEKPRQLTVVHQFDADDDENRIAAFSRYFHRSAASKLIPYASLLPVSRRLAIGVSCCVVAGVCVSDDVVVDLPWNLETSAVPIAPQLIPVDVLPLRVEDELL